MEDVMFVHRSKPLALSFACAALAVGLAAGPAQADSRKAYRLDSYCSAPEVCNQRQIGIIQKRRDGVNYFYGGSALAPPQVTYIYLRDDTILQPGAQPLPTSDIYMNSFATPLFPPRFGMKNDHGKGPKPQPGLLDLPGMNAGVNYNWP
jgi:hypothetical protein